MWIKSVKKKYNKHINFGILGIDIHSHLIPGIDDGSNSIEESLAILRKFVELGYKKIITTPHINSDYYRNTPEIIKSGLETLKQAATDNRINIALEAAAEYYIDFDFVQSIRNKAPMLTFGRNCLLVELSFFNPPDNLTEILFEIQSERYIPVLAHPERYNYWANNFEYYTELHTRGVLFQLNLNSLTGYYGVQAQKTAYQFIDRGLCSLVGSDCHQIESLEIMTKALDNKHFYKLIESGNLLNNTL